jgi:hypothetical protein
MIHLLASLCFTLLPFSKSEYFNVIADGSSSEVKSLIATIESQDAGNERNAYLGALKMKRAGQLSSAAEKLELFKAGKTLLETAISNDHTNVEYRFLRLIIQENSPKFLGYSDCIQADAKKVKAGYSNLSSSVKNAIITYAKTSKNLKL